MRGSHHHNRRRLRHCPGTGITGVTSFEGLDKYDVVRGEYEAITQPLYDSLIYAAAGQSTLAFFATQIGQGTSAFTGAKTLSDTNMQLPGVLPADQEFLVRAIELSYWNVPTAAASQPAAVGTQASNITVINDAYIFWRSGNLRFFVASKDYVNLGPLNRFPPQNHFEVTGAMSDVTTAAGSLNTRIMTANARGRPFILEPLAIRIQNQQAFGVVLNWPEGVQAVTTVSRVFVHLMGTLYRRAQ